MLGDAIAAPAGGNSAAPAAPRPRRERKASGGGGGGGGDTLASPLQGNVFKVLVEQGATVEEGALVCIIEAMKMENEITAHKAGVDRRPADLRGRRRDRRRHARGDHSRPAVAPAPTFSAWILRMAPLRRVSGSGASAPRSQQRRQVGPVLAQDAPARARRRPATPWPGHDVRGVLDQRLEPRRASRGRREAEPDSEIHGISTGER